jgi:DNA (cytosine-5)-methyltransferase 1
MGVITYGSLFAGIGGFDLGFDRAGMKCEWQMENDEFCLCVLTEHWPNVPKFGDVRGASNLPYVDVICGGFPCQDISFANPGGMGLNGEKSGLWHEMYRIVCEVEPRWIVVENVRRLLSINSGRDFGVILRDLARIGYDAGWRVLYAYEVGAPHRRARVFLVANRDGERVEGFWEKPIPRFQEFSWCQNVRGPADFRGRPDVPEPLVRRSGNGISRRLDTCGNAVLPQIAEWIGERIIELDGHQDC